MIESAWFSWGLITGFESTTPRTVQAIPCTADLSDLIRRPRFQYIVLVSCLSYATSTVVDDIYSKTIAKQCKNFPKREFRSEQRPWLGAVIILHFKGQKVVY